MPARAVTILYEDQRSRDRGFGLHALVRTCVFDVIDGDRHRVEDILDDCRPLNGVSNVIRTCREDRDLFAGARSVVAVVDDDKIRGHLRLPKTAPDLHVHREIKQGCPAPDRLFIVLLKKNTESVLEAAAACDPSHDGERMRRALSKVLLDRDAILTELARERARAQRDCILGKMPSLKAVVEILVGLLSPGGAPAKAAAPEAPPPVRKPRKPRR